MNKIYTYMNRPSFLIIATVPNIIHREMSSGNTINCIILW